MPLPPSAESLSQMSHIYNAAAYMEASFVTKTSKQNQAVSSDTETARGKKLLISLITAQLFLPPVPITAVLIKTPDVPS